MKDEGGMMNAKGKTPTDALNSSIPIGGEPWARVTAAKAWSQASFEPIIVYGVPGTSRNRELAGTSLPELAEFDWQTLENETDPFDEFDCTKTV